MQKLSCLTRWKSVLQCQLSFASSRVREDCCCAAFQSPCQIWSHELLLLLMGQCRERLLFVMKLFVYNLSVWKECRIYSFLLFTKEMTSDHATFLSGCRCCLPKRIPSCDTNFATRDISFWSIFKCLLHFFWRNCKRFLNGTNAILKFDNLASRCNFFRFLFALQLFLINF